MERDEQQGAGHDEPAEEKGHEGEDHREGPPGYDLDEQAAIEELRAPTREASGPEEPEE